MNCGACGKELTDKQPVVFEEKYFCDNICRYGYKQKMIHEPGKYEKKSGEPSRTHSKGNSDNFYKLYRNITLAIFLVALLVVSFMNKFEDLPPKMKFLMVFIIGGPYGFALTFFPIASVKYLLTRRFYNFAAKLPAKIFPIFIRSSGIFLLLAALTSACLFALLK